MDKLYVNVNGNDSTGAGTNLNPYKTIAKALAMTTGDTEIYLSGGVHSVYSLLDMSIASKNITYYGNGYDTVVEIQYCYGNGSFKGIMTIESCIIRPSNGFTGDTRALSYTSDGYAITFNHIAFTRSLNGSFPTSTMFYFHYNDYNFGCNKRFNMCTFINTMDYCIWLGACTLNMCTTNRPAIMHPSITAKAEYSSLCDQSYDLEYYLIFNDNRIYGVYSDNHTMSSTSRWRDRVIISSGSKYYKYINGVFVETTLDILNAFSSVILDKIDRKQLKLISPFKLVMYKSKSNNYKSINFNIKNNAFVLIDLSNSFYKNISFSNPHKYLVSNDMKTWDNYYDNTNHNSVHVENLEGYYLKDYIDSNCKYIDLINKRYNYILLKLNDNETLSKLLGVMTLDYKRVDADVSFMIGTDNKALVTVPLHTSKLIVNVIDYGKTKVVIDTMEVF